MKTIIIIIFLFGNFVFGISFAAPKIIIKLDDLTALKGTCSGKTTMDYLIKKNVKFSFGVIANTLDNTSLSTLEPYINATDSNGDKLLEIWNHGLEHTCTEFSDSYVNQKSHFDQATQLVKKYLGIQMHSFGSPCNTNNNITNQVVSEDPNYKVFMLNNITPNSSEKFLALNWPRVEFENGTGNPEYDFFVNNYKTNIRYSPKYMILQGHPKMWTQSQFEQFCKIIDFLLENNNEFVLPYEYYISLQTKISPKLQAKTINPRKVILNWIVYDTLKINYKIERSEDSLKWVKIGTNVDSTMTYIDTNISTKSGNYYYRVSPNIGIKTVYSDVVKVSNLDTSYVSSLDMQIYPNPGHGTNYVEYNIFKTGIVTCSILDLYGKLYKKIFCGYQTEGNHQLTFDSSNYPTGIYLCLLNTPDGFSTKKNIIKKD